MSLPVDRNLKNMDIEALLEDYGPDSMILVDRPVSLLLACYCHLHFCRLLLVAIWSPSVSIVPHGLTSVRRSTSCGMHSCYLLLVCLQHVNQYNKTYGRCPLVTLTADLCAAC